MLQHKKKYRFNEISKGWNVVFTTIFSIMAFVSVMPLVLVICISFSSSESLTLNGYKFFPSELSMEAYKAVFEMGSSFWQSYKMTVLYVFGGTALSLFIMSMLAYVLARKEFKYRSAVAFYIYFTTLFSGGLVPSYILNTRYLHINDTVWIFLLPGLVSAFDVIVLRTFVQTTIPDSLFDAAKIDGANAFGVYWRIVLPLFKAGLATIGLFNVVSRWNNWFTGILYITKPELVPVMTLLQRIQKDIDFLKKNSDLVGTAEGAEMLANIPSESTRMAITLIAILPLLVIYPFFQRHFVKGLTVGSVKG